jgi:ATP-dependent Lon protease
MTSLPPTPSHSYAHLHRCLLQVLPIGGVKEKTLAARRSGVRHIIFPEGNRRDWEELGEEVRAGLEPHFVQDYEEVYAVAFGQGSSSSGSSSEP